MTATVEYINIAQPVKLLQQLFMTDTADYWYQHGQESLQNARLLENLNKNIAENLILFIGDGLGIATVTSGRILKGQEAGQSGEEYVLNMETLPYAGLSKTYNTDYQVPDSAGTATAFLCGAKTKSGVIGHDDKAVWANCDASVGSEIPSILEIAQQFGKSVGIVTTTRVTHATPAGAYAHVAERGWETDYDIAPWNAACKDIAVQMLENNEIQVVLGGGRRSFMHNLQTDPEYPTSVGRRTDGRDLIQEWLDSKPEFTAEYVWNEAAFNNIDTEKTDYLLGLFEHTHMHYEERRVRDDVAGEPHIANMTKKAIEILSRNPNGFFLLVEGGRIDHAHHSNKPFRSLYDVIAMDEAVQMAMDMTSEQDTMIVVTADHSHVNSIVGSPSRGNPILGKVDTDVGNDDLPYTTILYANGPGGTEVYDSYAEVGTRPNITDVDTENAAYVHQALVPKSSETHGGDDVPIYAGGPYAHLVHGLHEQHYIPHVMMYAACIGPYTEHCVATNRMSPMDAMVKGQLNRHEW
ncbi:alkaline phosphatase-like [Glandiceps talaboti]